MHSHLQHFCPSPLDSKLLSKVSSLLPNRVIVFSDELPLITWSPQITGLLISFLPMAHGFTSETYTGFIIFGQPCFPLFRSYSEDLISIKVPPLSFSLLSFSQYLTLSLSHKFKNICMSSGLFFFLNIIWVVVGYLHFHLNFIINLSISMKNPTGIIIGITWILQNAWGIIDILRISNVFHLLGL